MLFKPRPARYSLSRNFTDATHIADDSFVIGGEAEWWRCAIDRKTLRDLMKRQDARPLANYLVWLALTVVSGALAVASWGSWWAVPAFLLYGTIYSSCDPRSHDLGHGTTFRSRWLNDLFLHLTLWMTMKEPVLWRWRHSRHHTDTIHVGRDPEIMVTRPSDLVRIAADFFFVFLAWGELKPTLLHAMGRITGDARCYVPQSQWRRMIWSSRLLVGFYLAVIGASIVAQSWLPVLLLFTPRVYGNWLNFLGYLTQHAALAEDAHDHRLNTRTFTMNPVLEFLYANLNYHIEHHIFPMVPYYNLPKLHALIRDQLPRTYHGLLDVHREVMPALVRQSRDPSYFVRRVLPEPALAAAA